MGKSIVQSINHLNYLDNEGRVYCRAHNELKTLGTMDCFNCPLFRGSLQGAGVECTYLDRVTDDIDMLALTVPDPAAQLTWITKLIDKGLIPADQLSREGNL